MFDNCLYDACMVKEDRERLVCEAAEAFVERCQELGVVVDAWRTPDFCRKSLCSAANNFGIRS